jgi:hypothetical protein
MATVQGSTACHVRPVRKAGWAPTWRPDPAAEVARVATPLRARWVRWRLVTACSPHAGRRGGVVTEEPVVASGGKVFVQNTTAKWRMRRQGEWRRGLTPVVARHWSDGAALRGGVRQRWSWHDGHRRHGPSPAPRGEGVEGEVGIKGGGRGAG